MWDYDKKQYSKEDRTFSLCPEGYHQVRITKVEYKQTSTQKDMFVISLATVGLEDECFLNYHLVFDHTNPGMTNQRLGRIYDSFDISEGNMNIESEWKGKVGAAEVIHEDYTDRSGGTKTAARVKNFLTSEKQVELGFIPEVEEEELPI